MTTTRWISTVRVTNEKNNQIRFMLDIFKKAETVVIWLGPDADDSVWSMGMLARLDHLEVRHQIEDLDHTKVCYEAMTQACRGMQKIISRP